MWASYSAHAQERNAVRTVYLDGVTISAYKVEDFRECHPGKHWIFENGIGIGEKFIRTYPTKFVNGEDNEIKPFKKFAPYYNAFTRVRFVEEKSFNVIMNLSSGVTIPNLAELSSDGLHEGVFKYEIGSPLLKNEQVVSVNFHSEVIQKKWSFYLSPFYNYFLTCVLFGADNRRLAWFSGLPLSSTIRHSRGNGGIFELHVQ